MSLGKTLKTTGGSGGSSSSKKIRGLYDYVQDSGLYVNVNRDLIVADSHELEDYEEIPLSREESISIKLPTKDSEAYNSTLLFSLFTGLMDGGTALLMGPPGCGKTTSAEIISHFLYDEELDSIRRATIYGHPEQTEEKMLARPDIGELIKNGVEKMIPRDFVYCPVHIVDEVNRLPPGKQSLLFQAIDRKKVEYCGTDFTMDGPLFATANYTDAGNFEMSPPFRDRFDIALMVNEPSPLDYNTIRTVGDEKLGDSKDELLKLPTELKLGDGEIKSIRKQINNVEMDDAALDFMYYTLASINYCEKGGVDISRMSKGSMMERPPNKAMCDECHYGVGGKSICALTENGLSPRTLKSIERYSKALAWFRGKDTAGISETKAVMPYTMWHKLKPTNTAFARDERYVNDRIGFVEHLVNDTLQSYAEVEDGIKGAFGTGFKAYDTWLDGYELLSGQKLEELRDKTLNTIKDSLNQLAEYDDHKMRIPLAQELVKDYHDVIRTNRQTG